MQQGFMHFHAAGNHQRLLMIAVECLLHHMKDEKNGEGTESESLPEEIMEQIVHLSQAMTMDMEKFTWALLRHTECDQSIWQFKEIEGPCQQLLDANLCVVDTAQAVASKHGHAPWIIRALTNISVRTKLIHVQLGEYSRLTSSPASRVCVRQRTDSPATVPHHEAWKTALTSNRPPLANAR